MERVAIHFIGIGGTGLSAIARVLLERGYNVSGSDRQMTPLAEALQADGVKVMIGHRAENIMGAELIVRSSAVVDDNPEVMAARKAGIPVWKRVDFIDQLMAGQHVIAVAGTHGKTTTTAMIAWMLTALDQDPSFIIGGVSMNLGTNAHAGKGKVFVVEADEYDRMFLGLNPDLAIVTNLEFDHPDCFPTQRDFYQAFLDFAGRLKPDSRLLVCADDAGAVALKKEVNGRLQTYFYGLGSAPEGAFPEYRAASVALNERGGYRFDFLRRNDYLAWVDLLVPGLHNVRNALAALAVADLQRLPIQEASDALGKFLGVGRRFEVRGERDGLVVIDDYAHHPSEIRATLEAARARYPESTLWAVWQPHTYTRIQALWDEFAGAFTDANHVLITEVYGAREKAPQGFSTQDLVKSIRHPDVHFAAELSQAAEFLKERTGPGDVILVLSAGDADQISRELLNLS